MLNVWIKDEGRMAELPVHGIGDCAAPFGYDWVLQDLYLVDEPPMDDLPEEAAGADWVFGTLGEAEWAASVLEKVCPLFDLYQNELSEVRWNEFWGVYEDAMSSEDFDAIDGLRVKAYDRLCEHLSTEAWAAAFVRVDAAVQLVKTALGECRPGDFDGVAIGGVSLPQAAYSVVVASKNLGMAVSALHVGDWDHAAACVSRSRDADIGPLYDVVRIARETDGVVDARVVRGAEAYLAAWSKVGGAALHVDGEVRRCTKRLDEVREALGL